jgi:hypothetical protein
VSERDRDRGAELRAERIRWKGRSRNMSRASKSMDERLRKMNDQASTLDKRLSRHAEESKSWPGLAWHIGAGSAVFAQAIARPHFLTSIRPSVWKGKECGLHLLMFC